MKSVTLSPVELFFLGKMLGARNIDYSYIAAMPDIQIQYGVNEQKANASLEEKGLIEVDFSGDTEVNSELAELLKPVFFFETETILETAQRYNFHTYEGKTTLGILNGESIVFSTINTDEMHDFLKGKNVSIKQVDKNKGYREIKFTASDLSEEDNIQKAISILKGVME